MKNITVYILAIILFASAIVHAIKPEFYAPMIPAFIPTNLANILAIIAEAGVGILLILPNYRKLGGLGFLVLMAIFLPIHGIDLFKENPVIGSQPVAIVRLVFQFVLMYLGWWIYKSGR